MFRSEKWIVLCFLKIKFWIIKNEFKLFSTGFNVLKPFKNEFRAILSQKRNLSYKKEQLFVKKSLIFDENPSKRHEKKILTPPPYRYVATMLVQTFYYQKLPNKIPYHLQKRFGSYLSQIFLQNPKSTIFWHFWVILTPPCSKYTLYTVYVPAWYSFKQNTLKHAIFE